MKVRIKETPHEPEIDGIKLDRMAPGAVREVSPTVAAWLMTKGYADSEMRRTPHNSSSFESDPPSEPHRRHDRRRHDF